MTSLKFRNRELITTIAEGNRNYCPGIGDNVDMILLKPRHIAASSQARASGIAAHETWPARFVGFRGVARISAHSAQFSTTSNIACRFCNSQCVVLRISDVSLPMEQLAKLGFASALPLNWPAADNSIATLFKRADAL